MDSILGQHDGIVRRMVQCARLTAEDRASHAARGRTGVEDDELSAEGDGRAGALVRVVVLVGRCGSWWALVCQARGCERCGAVRGPSWSGWLSFWSCWHCRGWS